MTSSLTPDQDFVQCSENQSANGVDADGDADLGLRRRVIGYFVHGVGTEAAGDHAKPIQWTVFQIMRRSPQQWYDNPKAAMGLLGRWMDPGDADRMVPLKSQRFRKTYASRTFLEDH